MNSLVIPLSKLSLSMLGECGGKAANLGELTRAGFNVPSGFCVKSTAYFNFLESNNMTEQIKNVSDTINFSNYHDVKDKCTYIRNLIVSGTIQQDLEEQIAGNYDSLKNMQTSEPLVAVRSSVAVLNTTISSFPGMMDTFHYICGLQTILEKIKECWASLWTERATSTRFYKKIDHAFALIAPVVQIMVNSEIAGVMFTLNPITSSKNEIYIESNWGLGEIVVSGQDENDSFLLDKSNLSILKCTIAKKPKMIVYDINNSIGTRYIACSPEMALKPTLTESTLRELAMTGINIENHYGMPQDIEFAYCDDKLFILQSRTARGCKG